MPVSFMPNVKNLSMFKNGAVNINGKILADNNLMYYFWINMFTPLPIRTARSGWTFFYTYVQ